MNYGVIYMETKKWVYCPNCGQKTRNKMRRYNIKEFSSLLSKMQARKFNQHTKYANNYY